MVVLAVRTDGPNAYLALTDEHASILNSMEWMADRSLATTLLRQIDELLDAGQVSPSDLSGVIYYKGPGSYTGLRIGASVANTLAYAVGAPIVGAAGGKWIEEGARSLVNGTNESIVLPEYGGDAHITM